MGLTVPDESVRPKAVGCGIFGWFSNVHKCRPQAAGDVISGLALDYVGMDAGNAVSRWLVGPLVLDKHVKFHDHSSNRSREIPPDAFPL